MIKSTLTQGSNGKTNKYNIYTSLFWVNHDPGSRRMVCLLTHRLSCGRYKSANIKVLITKTSGVARSTKERNSQSSLISLLFYKINTLIVRNVTESHAQTSHV